MVARPNEVTVESYPPAPLSLRSSSPRGALFVWVGKLCRQARAAQSCPWDSASRRTDNIGGPWRGGMVTLARELGPETLRDITLSVCNTMNGNFCVHDQLKGGPDLRTCLVLNNFLQKKCNLEKNKSASPDSSGSLFFV